MSTNIIEHFYNPTLKVVKAHHINDGDCGSPLNGDYKVLRDKFFNQKYGDLTEYDTEPNYIKKRTIENMVDNNITMLLEILDQMYLHKEMKEKIQNNIKVLDSNRHKIKESDGDNLMREHRIKNSDKNKKINTIQYIVFIVLIVIFLIVELILLII
tara:strand:- start:1279 stop:1746 length:468 start_codon:yes stop_codon:yes gene_type:complete